MGLRTLFLLIVIALVVWLVRRLWRERAEKPRREISGRMVRCAHCGLHIPSEECIEADGRCFCCAEHRDAYSGD